MSIYNPSTGEIIIYLCIFGIGFITGRIFMAIQVAFMKSTSKKSKHKKEGAAKP